MVDFENILLNNKEKSRIKLKDRLNHVVSNEKQFFEYLKGLSDKKVLEILKSVNSRFRCNKYWKQEEENVEKILKQLEYRAGCSTRKLMSLSRDYRTLKERGDLDYGLLKHYKDLVDSFEGCLFYNSYWKKLNSINKGKGNDNWKDEFSALRHDVYVMFDRANRQMELVGRLYETFQLNAKRVSKEIDLEKRYDGLEELVSILGKIHSGRDDNYWLVKGEVDKIVLSMDNSVLDITREMKKVEYKPVTIAQAASDVSYSFKTNGLGRMFIPRAQINVNERLTKKRSLYERIREKVIEKSNNFLESFCGYTLQPVRSY